MEVLVLASGKMTELLEINLESRAGRQTSIGHFIWGDQYLLYTDCGFYTVQKSAAVHRDGCPADFFLAVGDEYAALRHGCQLELCEWKVWTAVLCVEPGDEQRLFCVFYIGSLYLVSVL